MAGLVEGLMSVAAEHRLDNRCTDATVARPFLAYAISLAGFGTIPFEIKLIRYVEVADKYFMSYIKYFI